MLPDEFCPVDNINPDSWVRIWSAVYSAAEPLCLHIRHGLIAELHQGLARVPFPQVALKIDRAAFMLSLSLWEATDSSVSRS